MLCIPHRRHHHRRSIAMTLFSTEQKFIDWCKRDLRQYGIDSQQAKRAAIEYLHYKGYDPYERRAVMLPADPSTHGLTEAFAKRLGVVKSTYIEAWQAFLKDLENGDDYLPTQRWPVMRDGRKIGTLAYEFDESDIKSNSIWYTPRPGDIIRDTTRKQFTVAHTMGGGDLDCIMGFRR